MTQQVEVPLAPAVATDAAYLAQLEPVTVLGTGFLQQILPPLPGPAGHPLQLNSEVQRPLVEWDSLLRKVAFSEKLFSAWDPSLASRPTLLWDEMVRAKLRQPGKHLNLKQAHRAETVLRGSVVRTLKHAMSSAHVDQQKLDEFRAAAGKHIVSLNFDTLITKGENIKSASWPAKDAQRLGCRLDSADRTYWFPHGCVEQPESIRLGLRDYGFLPPVWNASVNKFKGRERTWRKKRPWTDELFAEFQNELVKHQSEDPAATLTGQLLVAPLIFFGTGLSESECGWWWLMNQRARNMAAVPEANRPATVIVRLATDDDAAFWAKRPAGITPLFVKDWDEGWRVLLGWLKHEKERQMTPQSTIRTAKTGTP
jgi:hypothetical protein